MKHLRILAFLYLALGALSIIVTVYFAYAMFGSGPASFSPEVQRVLIDAGYGTVLLVLLAFVSIGTFLTGYALFHMHRFALTLAKFFAVLGIFDFPLGTMLGIYTLWVLSRPEVQEPPKYLT